jgi:hypothetical protein
LELDDSSTEQKKLVRSVNQICKNLLEDQQTKAECPEIFSTQNLDGS